MELRAYFTILRRFWWLLLALPLLVGLFSLLTYRAPAPVYGYTAKFSVSFLPAPREDMDQDPRLGAVQASEYVADDLTEVVRGSRFAALVQRHLPADQQLPPGAIAGATRADKQHRILIVSITAGTPEQAAAIGQATVRAAEADLAALLTELWGSDVRLLLIDEGGPFGLPTALRSRLEVPLRVVLALVAAVALAFALDYLDDSVRSRAEAEALVGPVLAEIPK